MSELSSEDVEALRAGSEAGGQPSTRALRTAVEQLRASGRLWGGGAGGHQGLILLADKRADGATELPPTGLRPEPLDVEGNSQGALGQRFRDVSREPRTARQLRELAAQSEWLRQPRGADVDAIAKAHGVEVVGVKGMAWDGGAAAAGGGHARGGGAGRRKEGESE